MSAFLDQKRRYYPMDREPRLRLRNAAEKILPEPHWRGRFAGEEVKEIRTGHHLTQEGLPDKMEVKINLMRAFLQHREMETHGEV